MSRVLYFRTLRPLYPSVHVHCILDCTAEQEETERISSADDTRAIVAFVRTIGLKTGDKQSLELRAPTGQVIAKNQAHPLERNKAQGMLFAGSKRPPSGWDRGMYKATYLVERADQVVLQQQFELDLK
jgi:hypothetical protein